MALLESNISIPNVTNTTGPVKEHIWLRIFTSNCGRTIESDTSTVCVVTYWVIRLCPVFLLVIGTIGNILNIVILSRRRIRCQPISLYLLFLAVSDLVCLWTSLPHNMMNRIWLYNLQDSSMPVCIIHEWLMNGAGFFSIWLMTLISVERAILTKKPVYGKSITRTKCLVMILVNLCINLSVTGGFVIAKQVVRDEFGSDGSFRCRPSSPSVVGRYLDFWRLGFGVIIPFVSLFIANSVIILTLLLQRQIAESQSVRARSLTKLLVMISLYFIITMTPFNLYRVIVSERDSDIDSDAIAGYVLGYDIVYFVGTSNFAVNFIFYFMNSSLFKKEWSLMRQEWKGNKNTSYATMLQPLNKSGTITG